MATDPKKLSDMLKKEANKLPKGKDMPATPPTIEFDVESNVDPREVSTPDIEDTQTEELAIVQEYINTGKVPKGLTEKQFLQTYGGIIDDLMSQMDKPSGEKTQEELDVETENLLKRGK